MMWDLATAQVTGNWEASTGERARVIKVLERMLDDPAQNKVQTWTLPAVLWRLLSVHSIVFSPAGMLVCATSSTDHIGFWSSHGRRVASWPTGSKPARYVAYRDHGSALAYCTEEQLTVKDVFTEEVLSSLPLDPDLSFPGSPFAVTPDGRAAAVTQHEDVTVVRHDLPDLSFSWRDWMSGVHHGASKWDSKLAACGDRLHGYQIVALAWNATSLALANDEGIIQQWDIGDDTKLTDLASATEHGTVAGLAAHGSGFRALCATEQGNFALWDSQAGEAVQLATCAEISPCRITATTFHDSGNLVAAGFDTADILVWNAAGGIVAHLRPDKPDEQATQHHGPRAMVQAITGESRDSSSTGKVEPDHGGFQHYAENSLLQEAVLRKRPVTALCGWTWIPRRSTAAGDNLDDLPVCPRCMDIHDSNPIENPASTRRNGRRHTRRTTRPNHERSADGHI